MFLPSIQLVGARRRDLQCRTLRIALRYHPLGLHTYSRIVITVRVYLVCCISFPSILSTQGAKFQSNCTTEKLSASAIEVLAIVKWQASHDGSETQETHCFLSYKQLPYATDLFYAGRSCMLSLS